MTISRSPRMNQTLSSMKESYLERLLRENLRDTGTVSLERNFTVNFLAYIIQATKRRTMRDIKTCTAW